MLHLFNDNNKFYYDISGYIYFRYDNKDFQVLFENSDQFDYFDSNQINIYSDNNDLYYFEICKRFLLLKFINNELIISEIPGLKLVSGENMLIIIFHFY